MILTVPLHVTGVVRPRHSPVEPAPTQAALNRAGRGTIDIDATYRDGLDSLGGFEYAWLLTWLHQLDGPAGLPPLRQVPFLLRRQQRRVGIFATRGPRRINPIGLSLVQILGLTSAGIDFAGVDLVDGTPVIDIKPYVSRFDCPPGDPRCGWFDQVTIGGGGVATPAGLPHPPRHTHAGSSPFPPIYIPI